MNPAAIKQLAQIADGLAFSRNGILLTATPPAAHLPSTLARTGPAIDGPIFWRQNAQLVGWEPGAFAAWLVDARQCKHGIQISLSSPCQSASLGGLYVSLLHQDACRITPAAAGADDDSLSASTSRTNTGMRAAPGGWACNFSSYVPLQDAGSACDASGSKHAHATLLLQALPAPPMPTTGGDSGGIELVWLVVTLFSERVHVTSGGGCDEHCSGCSGLRGSCHRDGIMDFAIEGGAAMCV